MRFRPFAADELPLLQDLHADRAVQRYIEPDGVAWTNEALAAKLASYRADFHAHGWSKFAVFDERATFVGRAGFARFETGELELGYTFRRDCWGRGYATEAATALLTWIRATAPKEPIVAFAMVDNAASIAVLTKIGLRREADRFVHGAPHAWFRDVRA
ncbi:MAG: GNAT family N-acetyltransferase [Sphingomonas sp.]|uniref:GNAT family N-acetyltransferase n=1 Tax=Sphingomonas sp. TaxID=28214 RepID=UPI001AC83556|nr:GNAT family N-acetyltransferase [Sphingomonas sp.]MBN8807761.1 GNAT family N-acetyltransferase [Sphingomonas sp.]